MSAPPFVATVAVFVNPAREDVERVIGECGVTLLQFHGDEPPEFCSSFSRPYIKAARIRPGLDLVKYLSPYGAAAAWMLDAFHEDLWGGTGGSFDWSLVPERMAKPIILSGGLTADNVASAIRRARPYARSEEHTSELQSLTNLVCRLLLEKKKTECINILRLRLHIF